jgi:hypothetical protein
MLRKLSDAALHQRTGRGWDAWFARLDAFVDASLRDRWLPGSTLRVRTATAPKSLRGDWADGSSRIAVWFTPKGPAKTQVAVAHEKLADAAAVAAMKTYWRERLTTLKQLLES